MAQIARTEQQLGAILRRTRTQSGLTQSALAEKIGKRQATISRLENGESGVQLASVLKVLSALGLEFTVRPRTQLAAAELEDLF